MPSSPLAFSPQSPSNSNISKFFLFESALLSLTLIYLPLLHFITAPLGLYSVSSLIPSVQAAARMVML